MTNTTAARHYKIYVQALASALGFGLLLASTHAVGDNPESHAMTHIQTAVETLSARQQSIPLIAACMAVSDMPGLGGP